MESFGSATDYVVDVFGYFVAGSSGASFVAVTPCRVVDTRVAGGALVGGVERSFRVTGTGPEFVAQGGQAEGCGLPEGVVAVEASVSAVAPGSGGFARVWAAGSVMPTATFLNFTAGESVTNAGAVPVAGSGVAELTVESFGSATDYVVDVFGYYIVLQPVGTVFDGQSLSILGRFPSKVMTAMDAATGLSLWSRNVAVGSAAWHDLALTAVDRLFPYGSVALSTALVMNGGQSDLWDGESGAQVYAEEVAYAAAARAAGFDVVVAITICPGQYSEAEEAARLEHNDLLLADASGGFDAVVDVAALPELADPTDLTYYDALGIHWTEAGAQIAADAVAPVLQAKLGL